MCELLRENTRETPHETARQSAAPPCGAKDAATAPRASVLVADDEPEVARALARDLSHAGYAVAVALSAEEALTCLSEKRYDLLLSDFHLPGMTGDRMPRLARERDPDLAVVLITSAQDVTDAVEWLREGVTDYLIVPASPADVALRVGNTLERRRLVRENRQYQVTLEASVAEHAGRIRRLLLTSLETLSHALEAKDENTRNHSARVADLVTMLAERLAPEDEGFRRKLRLAALLQDIGKIGVPEAILNKTGKLEPDEFALIQKHPVVGEAILRPLLGDDPEIMAVVRHHHERWDGKGYPDRLVGEEASLGARIAAVADSYDALTSTRAYRSGLSPEQALQVLEQGAGTQWDPRIVAAAMSLAAEGRLQALAAAAPAGGAALSVTPPAGVPGRPAVIFVPDHLDRAGAERLLAKVEALLGRDGERSRDRFILDMQSVRAINTEAALLLGVIHQRAEDACGRVVFRDASEQARAKFLAVGLAETLHFVPPFRFG